jgi:hypothetical protein
MWDSISSIISMANEDKGLTLIVMILIIYNGWIVFAHNEDKGYFLNPVPSSLSINFKKYIVLWVIFIILEWNDICGWMYYFFLN